MDELVKLLGRFTATLELQSSLLHELIPVLDREEELIMKFEVSDFESLVVEKDQVVRRAKAAEQVRLQVLQRICFLIGYDARGALPSLRVFLEVFQGYLARVKDLLEASMHEQLSQMYKNLSALSESYLAAFQDLAPRINRNKTVLAKTSVNFARSLSLLRQSASTQDGYNAEGKSSSGPVPAGSFSSVRVKA